MPDTSVLLPKDEYEGLATVGAATEEDGCCFCRLLVALRMDSSLASSLSDAIVGTFDMPRLGSITKPDCSVWL